MANSIALAENYTDIVDELYSVSSRTAVLENNALVGEFLGANKIEILDVAVQYLGDYDRNTGYADGDITATWEAHELTQDRGRRFVLDVMDNEETRGKTLGATMSAFMKSGVVPEVDAYRFAKLSSVAGNSAEADLTSSTIVAAVDLGITTMEEAQVDLAGGFLFVTPTKLKEIENSDKFTRNIENKNVGSINFSIVGMYDELTVVKVPQSRFYTQIDLAASGAGGYTKTAVTGRNINFMIVAQNASFPVTKHIANNVIPAAQNNNADGDILKYRIYHDIFVPSNKTPGVYLHNATA